VDESIYYAGLFYTLYKYDPGSLKIKKERKRGHYQFVQSKSGKTSCVIKLSRSVSTELPLKSEQYPHSSSPANQLSG